MKVAEARRRGAGRARRCGPGRRSAASCATRPAPARSGWYVSARAAGQGGGPAFGPGSIRSEEPTGPDGVFVLEGAHRRRDLRPAGHGARPASARARPGVVAPAEGVELAGHRHAARSAGASWTPTAAAPIPDFEVRYQPDAQGGHALRDARWARAGGRGPVREAVAFHADDGAFVARRRAGGAVDGRGVRAGLPERRARPAVAVAEGEAAEGVEVRLSKGRRRLRPRARVARRPARSSDATVRAELSAAARAAHDRDAHGRRGRRATRRSPTPTAATRSPASPPAAGRVTASHPDWSEATAQRRDQGGARHRGHPPRPGRLGRAAPCSPAAVRWPERRSRSRRPGTAASAWARA